MNIITILWTSFIILIGLQLCVPDGLNEEFADQAPIFWCPNPLLRILYGVSQLIGVIFVISFALYLTFAEHWWYILIYLGGIILAKVVAVIIQVPIALIFYKQIQSALFYGDLKVKRIAGTVLVITSIVLFLALI